MTHFRGIAIKGTKLLLLTSLAALISCKCETACTDYDGNGGSTGGNGGGSAFSPDTLDCEDLDPNKVYLMGFLEPSEPRYPAVIDSEDPSKYCVTFPQNARSPVISEAGELFYIDGGTYIYGQEYLAGSDEEGKMYSSNPKLNDELLFSSHGASQQFIRFNGAVGANEFYYPVSDQVDTSIYLNGDEEPYYTFDSLASLHVLGVMPDGSILIAEPNLGLILLDANKTEIPLTSPSVGGFLFGKSKLFIDEVTTHQSAWLLVKADTDDLWRRWTLDLDTLVITDDGLYAPEPDGWVGDSEMKINGDGMLVQIASQTLGESPPVYSIIKRPLLSSGDSSIVTHSDADDLDTKPWDRRVIQFINITSSGKLFTGS